MNDSTNKPINLSRLAKLLKQVRRKTKLSLNLVSQATGISRRTLARLESGHYTGHGPARRSLGVGGRTLRSSQSVGGHTLSPRVAMRLVKLLLPADRIDEILSDATRLSRSLGDEPLYRYLDVLYDYPAVLFHSSAARALAEQDPAFARRLTRDFRNTFPLLLRSGFGTRNLGRRLRAFRLRHDLTLIETAALLDISKSELHRIESGQRRPSPRLRFRLLRLLTLPVLSPDTGHRTPATFLKAFLSLPPPTPPEFSNDPDGRNLSRADARDRLRYHWLNSYASTKALAGQLGISQPHLIRLLRGDRKPSRRLRERITALVH